MGSIRQRAGQRLAQLRDGREVRGRTGLTGFRVYWFLPLSPKRGRTLLVPLSIGIIGLASGWLPACVAGSASERCTWHGACCMAALLHDIRGLFVACTHLEWAPGCCRLQYLDLACSWGALR